ncbi:hypothetical protein [Chitinophaga pinensis]|uniref:hypothetical protein n=1 Tax=Chitinophaga pinensis TaxID=79329 RepID=UPI00019E2E46|nr:hypothetical protein [Chitinophaga pinensis]
MKKVVNKKISVVGQSFPLKVQAISADRERRMNGMQGVIVHSGIIDQLKKVRTNSNNSASK